MASNKKAKNAVAELERIARYEDAKRKKVKRRNLITIGACTLAAFAVIVTFAVVAVDLNKPADETDSSATAQERLDAYTATPPAADYTPQVVTDYDGLLPTVDSTATPPTISYPAGYTVPKDLVVKNLEEGTGEEVDTATQAMSMKYSGWNLNGQEFDSSFDPAKGHTDPLTVGVGVSGVIEGWTKGLAGKHHAGDKILLVIPNSLAYGKQKPDITSATSAEAEGPLVFYVEITGVGDPSKAIGAGS